MAANKEQRTELMATLPRDAMQLVGHVPATTDPSENRNKPASPVHSFDDLLLLDDGVLGQVFRAADREIALLALLGANPILIDRVLASVGPALALELRRGMARTGTLRLRDIDEAQARIIQSVGRIDQNLDASHSSTDGVIISA